LRHQILHGECLPLRQFNPEVPRDVQTCVAVAMDRDPARRYATAQAFADDLERFLQHRPIQARPIGWRLRLVRWGQRHPAWGTAAVLTLLAAAATPFLVQWTRGRADAQIASAKAEAHANLTSAIVAIEGILTSTRSHAMVRTPGLDGERLRQMQDAVRLMERLRRENADDVAVQKLYVAGMVRVADLRRSTGDFTGALAALDDAAPLLAGLRAAEPDALRHAVSHAGWCLSRGSALGELGRMDEATRFWQEVIATYGDRPAAELPPDLLLALASCHNNLGKVASSEGDLERAIVQLQQSVAYEDRMPAGRLTLDREIDRVRTQMNLGTMFRGQGKVGPAREQYAAVQRRVAELAVAHPGDPEVRRETARVEFGLANLAADEKDHTRSLPMRERCLAAMQQLVHDFPERVPYRQELAGMAHETSAERQIAGDLPGAEAAARLSIEVMQPLLQKAPDNLEYLSQLAVFHRQLSGCLWHQRQVEAARQELRQAVTMLESLVGKAPDDLHYRLQMAALWQELGLYHWNEERWEDARAVWRQAADCYEFVLGKGSALPRDPRRYPKLLSVLTQAELMCDDFAGVVRVLERLQELQPMPRARLQQLGADLHVADRADFQELLKVAPAADGPTRK
jgi:tetratricopeptide (TPR) repeat protein